MHVYGFGLRWIEEERLPEFKVRMGIKNTNELISLIEKTMKEGDEVYDTGNCRDIRKDIGKNRIIVRTYNGSVQTAICIPKEIPEGISQKLEFRSALPIKGEGDVVHEGIIVSKGVAFFDPMFPANILNLKPLDRIDVTMEIIPFEVKKEKKKLLKKERAPGVYPVKGEHRWYIQEIVGTIKNAGDYALIDAGSFVFFVDNIKNLPAGEKVSLKGPVFGYIKN